MKSTKDSGLKSFNITRCYFPWISNYEEDIREEEFEHNQQDVAFEVDKCALVLLDVWNIITPLHERLDEITKERIKPVVEECRKAGILIVHAPAPRVADKYPQYRFRPSRPEDWLFYHKCDGWPTQEMLKRTGAYAKFSLQYDEESAHLTLEEQYKNYFIHSSVCPKDGDIVIGDRKELHALLKDREIFNLFYVGFVSNGCILERDYGVRWVGYLGYDITLLKDCTSALENAYSLSTFRQTKSSVENLEYWISTTKSEDFIAALRSGQR